MGLSFRRIQQIDISDSLKFNVYKLAVYPFVLTVIWVINGVGLLASNTNLRLFHYLIDLLPGIIFGAWYWVINTQMRQIVWYAFLDLAYPLATS